jgi:hypothetical protein
VVSKATGRDEHGGPGGELRDTVNLVIEYAKQETIGPLRNAGRYLGYGVSGGLLIAIGLILLALSGLRALQTETGTALTGNWSWVPYVVMGLVTAVVAGLFAWRITKGNLDD